MCQCSKSFYIKNKRSTVNGQRSTISNQPSTKKDFDAIVVGSGPNGLAAGIVLQQAGLSVLILEAKSTVGGGLRSEALTLPGFTHDICSAVHPLAVASPYFQTLPLTEHGLKYLYPDIALAHPFDDGSSIQLLHNIRDTATGMGTDASAYLKLMEPLVASWPVIADEVLAPLHFPKHISEMVGFGWKALSSAEQLSKSFKTEKAKGFWAGLALHAQLPFNYQVTSGIGLVLLTAGHIRGWPVVAGGSQNLANALAAYFIRIGGKIELNQPVKSLQHLPSADAVLLDITPAQLLEIAGHRLSSLDRWQLKKYRYGMGCFKIDWALADPIPFTSIAAREALTLHLGGSYSEIALSESETWKGKHVDQPGVILAQQTIVDPDRAPKDRHTAWAYCHVPSGSGKDMTDAIEKQVERFAPGFRDRILARHTMDTEALEAHNANYIGGDIGGGANSLSQLFTRPALRFTPYRTSARGIYLCSSSTPPGGGVHGMCGYHAAQRVLKDIFSRK